MPAKPLMSWEGAPQFRWRKRVNGVPLSVSCKHLGLPKSKWTKEASYLAANQWLRNKLAEIQQQEPEVDPELDEFVATTERLIQWAATHAPDEVPQLTKTKSEILHERGQPPLLDRQEISSNLELAKMVGVVVPQDTDPEILSHLFGNRRIYQDRLKRHSKTEKQQTIGYLLDSFLGELKLTQKPQTHDEIHRSLKTIPAEVWISDAPATSIGAQTVSRHHFWLRSCKLSPQVENKRLGFFRRFVNWLYEEEHLQNLPRNLRSKKHRRKTGYREVTQFEGVADFIRTISPEQKAWALVCLNCGMTAADLGGLFWAGQGVDLWQERRVATHLIRVSGLIDSKTWLLRRRRSKTGDNEDTPTVTYKLWSETIRSIEGISLGRSGLVFLHRDATPMYLADYDATKSSMSGTVRKDRFGAAWRGNRIKLSKLRSIGANELGKNLQFKEYRDYYLCHAPKKVGDRHYYAEYNEPFFQALDFIRTSLNLHTLS